MNQKVLFFTASWCPWCRDLKPKVEELKASTEVEDCDLTEPGPRTIAKATHNLKSLPTLIFMQDDKEVDRWNAHDNDGYDIVEWLKTAQARAKDIAPQQ